jgi:hypothetical protein
LSLKPNRTTPAPDASHGAAGDETDRRVATFAQAHTWRNFAAEMDL